MQQLTFSSTDETILVSRAGVNQDFINKINETVASIRTLKTSHPNIGTVVTRLTSPTGEVFEITVT